MECVVKENYGGWVWVGVFITATSSVESEFYFDIFNY